MNKLFPFALIFVGLTLLYLGYQSANSTSSVLSHIFAGRPTKESLWMMIAGGIALVGRIGLSRQGEVNPKADSFSLQNIFEITRNSAHDDDSASDVPA